MLTFENKLTSYSFFLFVADLFIFILLWESKVLQYFAIVRYNLAFAEVVKMMNHIGLKEAKLAWYSSSNICQFYLLWFGVWPLRIFSFRPIIAWLLKLLLPQQHFLNHLVTVLWSTEPSPFIQQIFLIAFVVSSPSLSS